MINQMQIFENLDSTQLEARRQIDLKQIIINDAILTLQQTAGISTKKQFPWISKKGDLNISIILNIQELQKKGHIVLNYLPFCASLSVFDCIKDIEKQINKRLSLFLKWPNDILILQSKTNEIKKICGILCENYKDHFVIGIGCNLVSFPNTTEHFQATSLQEESGLKIDCIDFAKKIINVLQKNIQNTQKFGFEKIKNKWKQNAYMLGEKLLLRDNGIVKFEDITDEGYILAKKENGDNYIIISSDEVINKVN